MVNIPTNCLTELSQRGAARTPIIQTSLNSRSEQTVHQYLLKQQLIRYIRLTIINKRKECLFDKQLRIKNNQLGGSRYQVIALVEFKKFD